MSACIYGIDVAIDVARFDKRHRGEQNVTRLIAFKGGTMELQIAYYVHCFRQALSNRHLGIAGGLTISSADRVRTSEPSRIRVECI
jgi:hypothetical protein